ncbi:hypothetical protein K469DRAFT_180501 [Zopfia rhizophila CBS 207.26]|uniref:Uncharacterized protein n=1 Tax=Zopfia rhizophila CBS 207.26 TaxID=1314779 RepID=A0A6A6E1C1_9PEZI|nr:hypothetical protein K469DRAFT_180501 [Zopfia rhizophila CBS 207.26]
MNTNTTPEGKAITAISDEAEAGYKEFERLKFRREERAAVAFEEGKWVTQTSRMRCSGYCCSCDVRVAVSSKAACKKCSHVMCPACLVNRDLQC